MVVGGRIRSKRSCLSGAVAPLRRILLASSCRRLIQAAFGRKQPLYADDAGPGELKLFKLPRDLFYWLPNQICIAKDKIDRPNRKRDAEKMDAPTTNAMGALTEKRN